MSERPIEIEEVAHSVARFVDRDMLLILKQSRAWKGVAVTVSHAYLSTNRVRVVLEHAGHPAAPVEVEIEHHDNWLVAGVAATGWLASLTPEQLRPFEACLAYLYKRADVDLVREQVAAELPSPPVSIQVENDTLLVREEGQAEPTRIALSRDFAAILRDKAAERLIFARAPLTWAQWDAAWQRDAEGEGHPGLPGVGERLVRLPAKEQ